MLEMYLLFVLASGALIFLYEDEDEKKRIIKEQWCSDISGHKYVYCDVIDCVLLQELTVPRLV
jgi:hypothetical protein